MKSSFDYIHIYLGIFLMTNCFYVILLNLDTNLPIADKLIKEDLENGLECLQAFEKLYADIRTLYDCIVYQTKDGWRCIIDTANGDMEKAVNLGEYSKTHDVKSIDDSLSVSINVHDEGNTLEIVGMCSSHGKYYQIPPLFLFFIRNMPKHLLKLNDFALY